MLQGVLCAMLMLATVPAPAAAVPHAKTDGRATRDEILIGMHFIDRSNGNGSEPSGKPIDVTACFEDYLAHMEGDLQKISYADFWRWWYVFERYKGDEKGLLAFDKIVDACLERGIKIKVDLAWSTWWTQDRDWTKEDRLAYGPNDIDDWIHLCDLLGRHYRGRVAVWDLQGEANGKDYWPGEDIAHVQEVYRTGYKAFKRVDPDCLIGISGATPGEGGIDIFGEKISRAELNRWYRENLTACKGYYDNVPMNYFADIKGADPYNGALNYHNDVQAILDKLGERNVEIGIGEGSVQWAEDSYNLNAGGLSIEKQSRRMNQTLGELLDVGCNKLIFWGTEYAPGGGWPWRWGFRKYEDWWHLWPDSLKVPGTKIVFGYENPDGRKVDLRSKWNDPANPYYPVWEYVKFWAQSAPPASDAVRLPVHLKNTVDNLWQIAAYQQANDAIVYTAYHPDSAALSFAVDAAKTRWPQGTALQAHVRNETIDFNAGTHTVQSEQTIPATVAADGSIALELPPLSGFTTVRIHPADPALNAAYVDQVLPAAVETGQEAAGCLVLRNTGKESWARQEVRLLPYEFPQPQAEKPAVRPLDQDVPPGQFASIALTLPAGEAGGLRSYRLRLHDSRRGWFGPVFTVAVQAEERRTPRKLLAFREVGHIRLQWFAPEDFGPVKTYEVYRADGFEKPMKRIADVTETGMIDSDVTPDHAYYYQVVAVDAQGRRSRPSNEDNAQAISHPRFYDAEIVAQSVPTQVRLGEQGTASVTLKNTGTKPWDMSKPEPLRFWLQTAQLWGDRDETRLPQIDLGTTKIVEPGQTVTLHFPYVGPQEGRFENHWVLRLEAHETGGATHNAWFGTPLLAETTVVPK